MEFKSQRDDAAGQAAQAAAHLAQLELLDAAVCEAAGAFAVADFESLKYVYVNDAAARLWGLAREELLRLGPLGVAAQWSSAKSVEQVYADLVAQAPEASVDVVRATRHDGGEVLCEFHSRAVRSGTRWLIATNMRDITGEGASERHKLEVLQAAVDDAGDGVMIVDGQSWRYLYVNNMAAQMLCMDRDELMRSAPRQIMTEAAHWSADAEPMLMRAIASHPQPFVQEVLLTRRDGSTFHAEFKRRAIRLADRWIMISMVRDIGERRATQARLELFKRALDDADEGIYLIDPQKLIFLDVNDTACRLVGVSREELLARGPVGWEFSADELRDRFAKTIEAYPDSVVEERPRRRTAGAMIVMEKSRRAIRSEGAWLIIVHERDISEHKAAQRLLQQHVQELARSNEDLERFAYATSHDLSEPLRMMASYSQLLQRRYADRLDADAKEFIGFIVEGATRMKQLIDALLLYSRAGRNDAPMQPLALDQPLNDALANLAGAVQDAGAAIQAEALPTVQAEPVAMMQLFQNLVGNALKFRGPAAPVVRIRAEDMGSEWLLSISDNGIGIDSRYFERIFVVFQRLHARNEYEGTGIGLSICKKIVERHGGRIWVESAAGVGTTFRFTLPKKHPPGDARS